MIVDAQGLKFTMNEEGFKNNAYPDPAHGWAVPTIGVGHTGPEVHPGLFWSNDQVMAQLKIDMGQREDVVNAKVTVKLTQAQFNMLCDFTFNVGVGAFGNSTLLKLLNQGNYQGAADEFLHWNIPAMLIGRRQRERAGFMGTAVSADIPAHITILNLADIQKLVGVPADGIFGPQTKSAIVAWQHAHGLVPDGIVGPATGHAMGLM